MRKDILAHTMILLSAVVLSSTGCGVTETQSAALRGLPAPRESLSHSDGGPITHGLQLRFAVADGEARSERHALELTLLNASDRPITLVADPVPADVSVVEYEDALPRMVWFSTYPAIPFAPAQWMVQDVAPVRPKTLRPGEDLRIHWEVADDRVHSKIISEIQNAGFKFPSDGLYFVRAGMDLKVAGGDEVRLWSNEVSYVVGSKRTCPKPPTARVVESDPAASEVVIGVGRQHGTEVGDTYAKEPRMGTWWRLTVYQVDADRSRARAELIGTPMLVEVPRPFPVKDDALVLERPE